jgi:hypothetical protein
MLRPKHAARDRTIQKARIRPPQFGGLFIASFPDHNLIGQEQGNGTLIHHSSDNHDTQLPCADCADSVLRLVYRQEVG